MSDGFLDKAYELPENGDSRRLYAAWAASYEAELTANGYATPDRIAKALAGIVTDRTAPVLDYGCGTGLSGAALTRAGFTTLDGIDVTPEMLEIARGKGLYRSLTLADPAAPPPVAPGSYATIAAIGVIGVGAAPLSLFDQLMHLLPRDGLFAFSFNDHAMATPGFVAKVNDWVDCGAARLLMSEHGPHIPGKGLGSTIFVLRKA